MMSFKVDFPHNKCESLLVSSTTRSLPVTPCPSHEGGQTLMLINLIFLLVPSLGGQRKCWCWWYFNSSFAQCGWSSAIPDYDKCPSLWCWLLPNWDTVEDWGLAWKCCQLEKMLVGLLCFIFRVWPDSLNLFNPLDLRQSSPSPSP